MSEQDQGKEERIEDLEVPESETDDVKGGWGDPHVKERRKLNPPDLPAQKVAPFTDGSI